MLYERKKTLHMIPDTICVQLMRYAVTELDVVADMMRLQLMLFSIDKVHLCGLWVILGENVVDKQSQRTTSPGESILIHVYNIYRKTSTCSLFGTHIIRAPLDQLI